MAARVELAFRGEARALGLERGPVLLAVSGGSDSMALLHLFAGTLRRPSPSLTVAHLDHGLRDGSADDRAFVEAAAAALGLPVVGDRRPVTALRRRGESPEEAARRVRRAFLIEAAGRAGCTRIATGHTLDDQAETVLMRLLRGAGAGALAGMRRSGPGPFVRPLLGLERAELRDWLRSRGLTWREDPSNRDTALDRNLVRHRVLPWLTERTGLPVARRLVRAADRLREDAAWLDGQAESRLAEALEELCGGAGIRVEAARLADAGPALAGRMARRALQRAGCDARRITARHVAALLALAAGPSGAEIHLPQRRVARKRGRSLTIGPRRG